MKKLTWIFLLAFLYLAACQNQHSHDHDETAHTHENGDHSHNGEDHAHDDGFHTHADGTTHADHTEQEEFTVDSLSRDTLHDHGSAHGHHHD